MKTEARDLKCEALFRDIISYGDYDCLLDALCQPEFMSNIYLSIVRARHISPKRWMLNLQLFQ